MQLMSLLFAILHPSFIPWKESSLTVKVLDSLSWSLIRLHLCIHGFIQVQ